MMSNVPQFTDIEDRIVGPFTWRQLLWMVGMVTCLLVLYSNVSFTVFLVSAVPIVLLFIALAFYRPNNQPFIYSVIYAVIFLFRPKIAVWERPVPHAPKKKAATPPAPTPPPDKRLSLQELHALAQTVDRGHGS